MFALRDFHRKLGVRRGQLRSAFPDAVFKFHLRTEQSVFSSLLIVDVGAGAIPLDDLPCFVAHCRRAAQMPTIDAVRGLFESVFDLVLSPRSYRVGPDFYALIDIVGMQHWLPAPPLGFCQRHTGVVEPALIVIVQPAIGIGRPDNLRHRVGQLAKPFLCLLLFSKACRERRS